MKEWSKKNWFNSFNSAKGLLFSDWYKAIDKWRLGEGKPLPPIEVSFDPIHACNLNCEWCNASRYLNYDMKDRRMTDEHIMNLTQFLGEWGVKGICFGGGGESTLHTKLPDAMRLAKKLGVDTSIATNGTVFTDELIDTLARCCRWVGISMDSATPVTYEIGRKVNLFDKAISNMKKVNDRVKELKTNCDVAYKFLIFQHNQHEIYDACKLAKETGVKDFHARPADFSHQGMDSKLDNPYDIENIFKQFEKCHELEDENFRVFTVIHKFNKDFTPVKDFKQCYAASICIQLCADGNIYLCPDQRHSSLYKLGTHYPDPKNILNVWGGKKHYDLVFKTGKKACKTRCTYAPYNIQAELLFINKDDPMCWRFV